VMEPPVAVLGAEQGPRAAHKLMREHQVPGLMVVDRDRKLQGMVVEDDLRVAMEAGRTDLTGLVRPAVTVGGDVAVADLFAASADNPVALGVVDDDGRLLWVIPRVTLLAALGAASEPDVTREVSPATAGAPEGAR
jgi:glycine betaine/proline transport system ATP-binding protein